jgi:DDRGK domain
MSYANQEVSVGASDSLILAVSLTGFAVLATTLYFVLIRPIASAQGRDEGSGRGGGGVLTYEQLKQAKVADLNRAQRRARARTIAKEETKALTAGSTSSSSSNNKQERQRVQRDIELRERRAEQEERDQIQREQVQRAALAKEQRDARKQQERTAQTLANLEQWETFLKTNESSKSPITVVELIERLQRDRYLDVEGLSLELHLSQELIIGRLNELVDDGRIAGVFVNDNNRKSFVYFSDHELRSIAKQIESTQKVSYAELAAFCNDQILRPSST